MSTQQPGRDVWSDLVGGLLDARRDPATARFDADLAAAVAAGSVTEETAHRLRFWQRASVRALADHARTVLPVALGALAAAGREAETYAEEGAAALRAADPDPPRATEPECASDPAQEPQEPQTSQQPPPAHPAKAPAAVQPERHAVVTLPDEARRASTSQPSRPSTLEGPRPRLLVADLTIATARPDRTS